MELVKELPEIFEEFAELFLPQFWLSTAFLEVVLSVL